MPNPLDMAKATQGLDVQGASERFKAIATQKRVVAILSGVVPGHAVFGVGGAGALGDIEVATHLAQDLLCFESSTYANLS